MQIPSFFFSYYFYYYMNENFYETQTAHLHNIKPKNSLAAMSCRPKDRPATLTLRRPEKGVHKQL